MAEINELQQWMDDHMISYKIMKDVVTIPEFGRCLFQDMTKREHIFKENKLTGDVEFDCVEVSNLLIEDEIYYVILKFGDQFYYTDIRKDFKLTPLRHIGKRKEREEMYIREYVNLGIHTPFELLNGSGAISEWIKTAKWMGHKSIGICDKNTMAATLQLQKEARSAGIGYVFGYSLVMQIDGEEIGAKIYVHTQKGFRNLLRIQKAINVDREDGMVDYLEVLNRADGNVIIFDKWSGEWMTKNKELLNDFDKAFDGWVFFQVDMSEYRADRIDSRLLESQKAFFDGFYKSGKWDLGIEPVLIEDCYYIDADEYKNKIVLNKIDTGVTHELSYAQFYKDVDQLYDEFCDLFSEKYGDDVFDLMVDNTVLIASESDAEYNTSSVNYAPRYSMTEEEEAKYGNTHNMFNQLIEDGFQRLVPKGKESEYRKRLEYEKYVIESTDNVDYYLITWDEINWARKNGIAVGVGRGSAGGCLLSFLLGITQIDPMPFDLLFERFLLPERGGLEPAKVTIIGDDISKKEYVEVKLENGKTINFADDAEFLVKRNGEEITVIGKELQPGDDIVLDRKDELFTIDEL